jgi:hypothetical protein
MFLGTMVTLLPDKRTSFAAAQLSVADAAALDAGARER